MSSARAAWRATCRRGGWALLAGLCVAAFQAHGQTWTPATSDWNTGTNWTPNTVPTGTANFGAAGITSVTIGANATIGTLQFNAGAPAYTFTLLPFPAAPIVSINGSGIVNNSANAPTFIDNSTGSNGIFFSGSSTAGNAIIIENNQLEFNATSSAGSANITSNFTVRFNNGASAGNAVIVNNSLVDFNNTSTAANATITNNAGGLLFMANSATAGNAIVITNGGGAVQFSDTASGGTARFVTNAGGSFDISQLTAAGTSVGSIEGAGSYFLGGNNLTVGTNNLSTTVSGVIADGGVVAGIGGSLTKIGAGTLTLTGINTYTGATAVNGGTLVVNGSIATSNLTTINAGGTLSGVGTVGNLTVANGGIFAPGPPGGFGTMTVGNLTVQPGGVYFVQSNGTITSTANVTGTATLTGGSVRATVSNLRPGSIDILHAAGGLAGTNFANVSVPLFLSSLTYTSTDVFLNLVPATNAKVGWIAATQQQLSFSQVDTVLQQIRDQLQKKKKPRAEDTAQPTAYAASDRDIDSGSPRFAAASLPGGAYAAYDAAPTAAPQAPAWGAWFQGQEDWQRDTPLSATDTGRVTRTHSGQVGVDLTWKSVMAADDAFVLGSVVSTMTSDIADIGSPTTSTLRGPGVGTYAMYVRGGFSSDLTAKLDGLGMHQYLAGIAPDTSFSILNAGLSGNLQYKFSRDDDRFIEPTIGFSFTRTMFDSSVISAFGLRDSNTVRVQAGARIGTSWKVGDIGIDANLKSLVYSDVIAEASSLIPAGFAGITPNDQGLIRGEFDPDLCLNLADGYSITFSGQVRFGQAIVGGAAGLNFRKQW